MSPPEIVAWILAGCLIGAYAGAIGAGGGFLVTPLLLFRFPSAAPAEVTAAALMVVAATSVVATALAWRERRVDFRLAAAMASLIIPAGLLGAAATALVPRSMFAVGFGIVLLLIATYLLLRPVPTIRGPIPGAWQRSLVDRDGNRFAYRVPLRRGSLPMASVGFISSLAGIGGGPIGVPMLTHLLHVPHAIAIPTMHFAIVWQSLGAVGLHLGLGHVGEPIRIVPWLVVGVVLGGPIARRLRRTSGQGRLTRALAAGLFIVAIRTITGAV